MRDPRDQREECRATLHELTEVIEVAARLADTLANDATLHRVIEALRLMPLEDRAVVATAIEREVQARRLSLATENATGQSMHANPHARLYLRSHESVVPRQLLERDELMLAMLRGMRVTPILLVPDIHAAWADGTREAIDHLEPAAREAVAQLLREALVMLEESNQASSPSPPSPEDRAARAN
jgi:hypothetical protein